MIAHAEKLLLSVSISLPFLRRPCFRRHRVDDFVSRAMIRLIRCDLIAVDIGLLPISPGSAEGFYRRVDVAAAGRCVTVRREPHLRRCDDPTMGTTSSIGRGNCPPRRARLPTSGFALATENSRDKFHPWRRLQRDKFHPWRRL